MSKTNADIPGRDDPRLGSKAYRLNHLYKIQTKEKEIRPIKMKAVQTDYLTRRKRRNFILKSRRIGFSTACLIDMLDDTITTRNVNSAIIAHEKAKVQQLFEIVKRAYDGLPGFDYIKPPARYDNRNELYFPTLGSKIYVTMDTRGLTVHNLHISELAFIKDPERIKGSLESVPDSGRITFETTANGMSGYAFEEWMDEDSEFEKFFYPWYKDPDAIRKTNRSMEQIMLDYEPLATKYGLIPDIAKRFNLSPEQMEFYLARIKRQKDKVMQEYPTTPEEAFISSGKGIFHTSDLAKHVAKDPIRRSGDTIVWEEPLGGFFYVLGVDPAEGTGNDNSVIEVFNANTGKQAAEYANNRIQADELATLSIKLAKEYNHALIVPEINSPAYISHIRRKYDNIYRREIFDKITQKKTKALGWRTTAMSKKKLVEEFEEATRNQDIDIMSAALKKEMTTFVRTDETGKQGYGAEGSNHDDRVIAAGLAVQGMQESPKMKTPETGSEIAKKKLQEWIDKKNLDKNFPNGTNEPPSVLRRKKQYGKNYAIRGINR